MNNLYDKIYEAINTGIQKALIINNGQTDDVSIKFHNKGISNAFIPYELRTVDLGLPSGLLWCEYNLGAIPGGKAENWYGEHYAWGEIFPKEDYSWGTYTYSGTDGVYLIKYNNYLRYGNIDNLIQLEPEDDAAYSIINHEYRMPTDKDCDELLRNTIYKWIKNYDNIPGLNGMLFTSATNGNTLFIPASGYSDEYYIKNTGNIGEIWTSILDNDNPLAAIGLHINSGGAEIGIGERQYGRSIRAVKENK